MKSPSGNVDLALGKQVVTVDVAIVRHRRRERVLLHAGHLPAVIGYKVDQLTFLVEIEHGADRGALVGKVPLTVRSSISSRNALADQGCGSQQAHVVEHQTVSASNMTAPST